MSRNLKTDTELLPRSGKSVTFKEMTGYEEDLLTDRKMMKSGKAIEKFLSGCIVELDGNSDVTENDVLSLFTTDRVFLMIKIRQLSYGDIIEQAEVTCPNENCGEKNYLTINLSELPETIADDTDGDKLYTIDIEEEGIKLTFRDLVGKDEQKLFKVQPSEAMSVGTAIRLVEVIDNGETVHPNGVIKWYKGLPARLRNLIRSEMEKVQVGIDSAITVKCDNCGQEWKIQVETLRSFFFPGM